MVWKPIHGYEGYYEVSDTGKVRSLDRSVPVRSGGYKKCKGAVMKSTNNIGRDGNGYLVLNLTRDGKHHMTTVHRLVAEAFIPNPDNLPTINHIDGNKKNNCVSNLEWASYSENNSHALSTHLRSPRGTPVCQMDADGNILNVFRSVCEASRATGIGRSSISHCVNGRQPSTNGFIWKKYRNV